MKKYLHLLKKMPLFNSIEEDKISNVIYCLEGYVKSFNKNETIYNSLDSFNFAGIVLEGKISVTMLNFCGNEYGIANYFKGDLFGDTYACIPNEKPKIQVMTNENSTILFLKLSNLFLSKAIHCPYASQISVNLLKETVKSNTFQNNKIQILIQKHIRDKIIIFLSYLKITNTKTINLPYNRQELADYLCVDRSALSRELGRMKKDGIIDFHKNTIYILDESFLCNY